jgi:hypothetical protein
MSLLMQTMLEKLAEMFPQTYQAKYEILLAVENQ